MSYDFSPLISQYCKAKEQYCKAKEQYCETEEQYRKAEKAKESSNYFLRKKKSELFHSILKNGTLYPCPEGVDREDYTLLKNEAIAEALIVVCEEYDPTKSNLSTWINKKLRFEYKIRNLLSENKLAENKLDKKIYDINNIESDSDNSSKGSDLIDRISEEEPIEELVNFFGKSFETVSPSFDNLGIIKSDQQKYQDINLISSPLEKWMNYVEQDPDNVLKGKYLKDRDGNWRLDCNDHVILKFVILEDLKNGLINQAKYKKWFVKLRVLAKQFNISEDTLNSRLHHSKRPHTIWNYFLAFGLMFGVDYLDKDNKLKKIIEHDPDKFLEKNHLRHYPLCHSQWLAKKRLPYFVSNPCSFENLVECLGQEEEKYYRLKSQQIENHWYKHTLPRLGQLLTRLYKHLNF